MRLHTGSKSGFAIRAEDALFWFESWTRGHQDGPGAGLL